MSNGPLAYGLECDTEKYFDREAIQNIKNEAGLMAAMKAHGLDYEVEMHQLTNPVNGRDIPFYATVRTDTNAVLGCGLSSRYNPIQNKDGFALIADLAQEVKDGVIFARGMTFDAGRVAVAQIDMGEMVIGDKGRGGFVDKVKKRLTWTNSHDGSGAAKVFTTPIRIVCANTLTAAMQGKRDGVTIRHTETAKDRLAQARELLHVVNGELVRTEATYNAMANKKVTKDHIREILADLFDTDGKTAARGGKVRGEAVQTIEHFYNAADGNKIERETGWNLYNAITHYTDHTSPIRIHNGKSPADARFQSVIAGSIAEKNAKALSKIVRVLELDDDIDLLLRKVETSPVAQLDAMASGSMLDWMMQDVK